MDREELEAAISLAVELTDREYAEDSWKWMKTLVKTKDEATQQLLPFPHQKTYLQETLHALETCSKLAIPKSRRMFASWIVSLYAMHKARYEPYHAIYWQSEQESKAAFVIDQRIKFVEDNLDALYRREYDSIKTKTGLVGKISYKKTGSYVLAIPQGDSQIRSYTPSILIMDECEFMPEAPLALKAALSTVEKDAQIVLLSTSNGPSGILAAICRDVGFTKFD